MRRGAPVIIHGDGTNLWPITHHRDFARAFVGLIGNAAAIGEDFHITSDDAPTWNQIYGWAATAAGVDAEAFAGQVVHVATDRLVEESPDEFEGSIRGDKGNSVVFDNSKVKAAVPGWSADTSYADGIHESIAWFDADPSRRSVDDEFNALCDRIAARWS
jgi:nucleoside-diphosphate-sugar epimerase